MSMRAADDFDIIRARRDELRRERDYIEIAGPAGNPTQPIICGSCGATNGTHRPGCTGHPPAFCGICGTDMAHGMPHSGHCPKYVSPQTQAHLNAQQDYGDCCGWMFPPGQPRPMQARLAAFATRVRAVLEDLKPAE